MKNNILFFLFLLSLLGCELKDSIKYIEKKTYKLIQ
jgi:hypothetical protein